MRDSRSRRGSLSPLRAPDFRLLLSALAISSTGDWLYNTVLLVFIYERTRSAAWVAAATILRILPEVLFAAVAGVVADRYGRLRVMISADLGRALLMFALAAAALAQVPVLVPIVIVFVATAVGTPSLPALTAMTPALVTEGELAAANSLISVVDYTALALGPALGGLLVILGAPPVVFALNGLTFLVSATLLSRMPPREDKAPRISSRRSLGASFKEGVQTIRRAGDTAVLVGLIPAMTVVPGSSFVLLVAVSEESLRLGPGGVTFLFAAVGLGGLLAAGISRWLAGRTRPGMVVAASVTLLGACFAALAVVRAPALAYVLCGSLGASLIVAEVLVTTILQRVLPEDLLARVFGIVGTAIYAGILVGALSAPLLLRGIGLGGALLTGGAVPIVAVCFTLRKLASIDREAIARLEEIRPRVQILENLAIFEGLPRDGLEAIATRLTEERVGTGVLVVEEGARADAFYVVVSGTLGVTSLTEQGKRATKENRLLPGDYFGEIGLLMSRPRTATVTALTDCLLYRIDGDDFLRALSPNVPGRLLDVMGARLALTHQS